ncbi:MAG: LamG domain-containing protein [Cycloclasticus sp.]|nr:LamG domain-containing protein [Cycloclasticus sp.]
MRAMVRKASYVNALQPIAEYPLALNSNEIIGTTSGIDGIDTSINYNGTEATFNGNTSFIEIPANDIFSFTDGVNDLPFTIEFEVKLDSIGVSGVWFVNKRGETLVSEYQLAYDGSTLFIALTNSDVSGRINKNYTYSFPLNIYVKIKVTYDGSKDVNGLHLYVNDIEVGVNNVGGVYVGMSNTHYPVTIGRYGWVEGAYLDGTMKDLKFYNYVN